MEIRPEQGVENVAGVTSRGGAKASPLFTTCLQLTDANILTKALWCGIIYPRWERHQNNEGKCITIRRKFNYEKPNFVPLESPETITTNIVTTRLANDYGPTCGWVYTKIVEMSKGKTVKFTQVMLARETGCDESTLRDYINLLCDTGYLVLVKKGFSNGQHQEASEYAIADVHKKTGLVKNGETKRFPKYER